MKRNMSEIRVGDIVEFELFGGTYVIDKYLPRKNFLLRPPVCNVDQVVVVLSSEPKPDFMLVDKIVINAIINEVGMVLCINKSDIISDDFVEFVRSNYADCVDELIVMSALTSEGMSSLKAVLKDKISCMAGQSAVGKSSIANLLVRENRLEIGALSVKSRRGKHTTRHSELLKLDFGGYIVDTPGFTFFDGLTGIEPCFLSSYYTDFEPYIDACKFKGCTHISESVCGVKQAVESGKLSRERYQRYVELYSDLKKKWDNRY